MSRQERNQDPLLQGLALADAGSAAGNEPWRVVPAVSSETIFGYCLKGSGWCEVNNRLHGVRQGDFFVLPPGMRSGCGPQASNPWSILWAKATGNLLGPYLEALSLGAGAPVLHTGDDPLVHRLFNEILQGRRWASGRHALLRASHALGYLLAVLIEKRQHNSPDADTAHKVAQAIIFMSDNLDRPVRVSALARLAGLSPTYFSEIFKQQTGCSPRDYLYLLRMHRACRFLNSALSVKEIAARLGYRDPFQFSRQFKAFQGLSPSDYRESRPV